jgi:hypothetical protein
MFHDVADLPGPGDLSGLPVVCPLCRQVHERCVFTAGSVYCIRPGCRNPHHRRPPAAPDPAVWAVCLIALPQVELEFYSTHMPSPDADRLIYGRIAGTAARHAPAWRADRQDIAAAIAELAEIADGRADLLAKCAGLALGYGERQPEAAHYQRMAELCIAAGADKTLIQWWIDIGRRQAAPTGAANPYTGLPPDD